jgi:hypothetical protein
MSTVKIKTPGNIKTKYGRVVTSDVYNVAEKVQELDPNLMIVETEPKFNKRWLVVEMVNRGGTMEVTPVKRYAVLDSRVVEDLERMLRIPLEERLKELDDWMAAEEKAKQEAEYARLWELGEKAEWAARKDGLIHVPNNLPFKRVKQKKVM